MTQLDPKTGLTTTHLSALPKFYTWHPFLHWWNKNTEHTRFLASLPSNQPNIPEIKKKKKRKTSSFNILTSLSWHIIARKPITIKWSNKLASFKWHCLKRIKINLNKYKHSCIYQNVKNVIIFKNSFCNKSSK